MTALLQILLFGRRFLAFLILFFCFFNATKNANSASLGLIRDAESEKFLRQLSTPIFEAAGLEAKNIKIYIVGDSEINAFVSGGQNIFINTGLIRKYKTPDALIGVISHEVGHIAAGHLARSKEGFEQASGAMFLSYLLGAGAIVAGAPDAGLALIAGGTNSAQRLGMKYTRNQEEAADNHALNYLQNLNYPANGLIELLESFERETVGRKDEIDEYLLSHPVSRKRIDLIKNRVSGQKFSNKKINESLQSGMNIVLAKLEAFIDDPNLVLEKNQNSSDDLSKYKSAIALFRKGEAAKSLKLLDEIIAKKEQKKASRSEIAFLYELRGQISFESGAVFEASLFFDKAIKNLDSVDSSQAKIAFASSILAVSSSDKDLLKLVILRLEEAKKFEEENSFLFKELAFAYDKNGDEGRSLLALAHYNFLIGNNEKAEKYAKNAEEKFAKASPERLQAEDLLQEIKKSQQKNNH